MTTPDRIRNLAIIAHIDHGKTTLIDSIFRAAHVFRDNEDVAERVMDSLDLERERGITIRSKHCTVEWEGFRINIVDTPGHADFSGEVERVLSMVDGALLLVDANEGPMPQTRYVLMRALKLGLRPIVVLNKVDRPSARPDEALHDTFDLFLELGASDEQADFPVLYGSGLDGWFVDELRKDARRGMGPLFETIIGRVPPPSVTLDAPFRMQVSTLAWSDYLGRIGCGRVLAGSHRVGDPLVRTRSEWEGPERSSFRVTGREPGRSSRLWVTRGVEREEVEAVSAGDIVWVAGFEELGVGDTLGHPDLESPALPPLEIEEPTVSMLFLVNSGPLAGSEGKAVTLRQIRDRLEREARVNVALRIEDVGRADGLKVSGRGELHLAILIEEMRREGIELCVSRPEVITREAQDGTLLEPIEDLVVEIPDAHQGSVYEKLARRRAELVGVHNGGTGLVRLSFTIPTRGLIGYRSEFLTDTRGLGILTSRFRAFAPWRGDVEHRDRGAMVSLDAGAATSFALENLQPRGTLFVKPMDRVYAGMIIGESARPGDLPCNPTKRKHVTNHRSSTRDVDAGLKAPREQSLDQALEWIAADELVEVTPQSIRVRKAILDATERRRADRRFEALAAR
ncbi:MAG TPA: translational GTPase TypA [Gemmatimonadota bacterium]|nr:translational GTPase TypA [Gemmatimonadota bacterium]